jgi:MFS family permease
MTVQTSHVRLAAPIVSAVRARRTLLLLTFTRWFPTGLVIGLTTLLELQRGMSLSEVGLIGATQGFVILCLELPTGGLADALGRRPVLVAAGVIGLASWLIFVHAHTLSGFLVAAGCQGVYRALDSGPLEAWYVDTAHAENPDLQVGRVLALAGTVLGVAIAGGALISGGLVAWHPFRSSSALVLPFWISIGATAVHLAGNAVLVREVRTSARTGHQFRRSLLLTPTVVVDGIALLRGARVLRSLVLVEVFWGVAMIGFETLNPVRLAELIGGEDRAGVIFGPVSSASWGLFAAGSMVAGLVSRRIGVAWTALAARILNGLLVVAMGLATGPAGLVIAFLITYTLHGAAGPMHSTLLHREASSENRATVLSMNSMVSGGTMSAGLLILGPLAQHTSTATAIIVAGAFSVLGAVCYVPALRVERHHRVPVGAARIRA